MGHLRKFVQSFPDGKNSSLILRGLLEVGNGAPFSTSVAGKNFRLAY